MVRLRLVDVCRPRQWPTLSKVEMSASGFPVYGANGKIGFAESYTHVDPVLLIGCRGSCGTLHITEPRSYANGNAMALDDLNTEVVDIGFLYHQLRHRGFDDVVSGSSQPQITQGGLSKIELDFPTLREQQRIATILDRADRLRSKRQEAIRLADDFLRAVFHEKFGDPVSNSKALPTSRIDQLCDVATGSTPARSRADYYDGQHAWIKTGEVDTPLITSAEEHISDAAIAETNCKLFPVGTLLIAMYGQGKTRGKVGMLGIPAATNQACAAILPSQKINRYFLYTQLALMYEHLRAMGRGGNQENLNLGMIKSLEVLVPPSHLVNEFLKVRQKVSEMTTRALSAQAETEAMIQSLAAKFFS